MLSRHLPYLIRVFITYWMLAQNLLSSGRFPRGLPLQMTETPETYVQTGRGEPFSTRLLHFSECSRRFTITISPLKTINMGQLSREGFRGRRVSEKDLIASARRPVAARVDSLPRLPSKTDQMGLLTMIASIYAA